MIGDAVVTILPPLAISSRLMVGVQIANAWIQIEPAAGCDAQGRPLWRWVIDITDETNTETSYKGEDLAGFGEHREMLKSLLAFLYACGESFPDGENVDLFPPEVAEWADYHSDEIALMELLIMEKDE